MIKLWIDIFGLIENRSVSENTLELLKIQFYKVMFFRVIVDKLISDTFFVN